MFKLLKSLVKSTAKGFWSDPNIQHFLNKHPRLKLFLFKRSTPDEKYGLVLTIGVLVAIYFAYLFYGLVRDYYGQDLIIQADLRILNLVQVLREPGFNKFMLFVTYLGGWQNVLVGMLCVAVVLILQNRWNYILTLIAAVGFGEVFVAITKNIIARPRPPLVNALAPEQTYSFPSGHSFVAIAFYGLLAYFIFINVKSHWAKIGSIIGSLTIIFSIGFSRIYLGAHWPSDVFSSYAVGAAWIAALITALEIKRRFPKKIKSHDISRIKFVLAVLIPLVIFFSFVTIFYLRHPLPLTAVPEQVPISIIQDSLSGDLFEILPRTSEDLVGNALEPIHLVFIGSRNDVETAFRQAGWEKADRISIKTAWKATTSFFLQQPYPTAPGIPSFWNSVPNDFAYEKSTEKNSINEREHIHFWETNYFVDNSKQVWMATAHFDMAISFKVKGHDIDPAIDKERDRIRADLEKAGLVDLIAEFQIVEPTLGQNQVGSAFFTDGRAYLVFLKSSE